MDWTIWKTAEPTTTKRNNPISSVETGYWSSYKMGGERIHSRPAYMYYSNTLILTFFEDFVTFPLFVMFFAFFSFDLFILGVVGMMRLEVVEVEDEDGQRTLVDVDEDVDDKSGICTRQREGMGKIKPKEMRKWYKFEKS